MKQDSKLALQTLFVAITGTLWTASGTAYEPQAASTSDPLIMDECHGEVWFEKNFSLEFDTPRIPPTGGSGSGHVDETLNRARESGVAHENWHNDRGGYLRMYELDPPQKKAYWMHGWTQNGECKGFRSAEVTQMVCGALETLSDETLHLLEQESCG